MTKYDAAQSNIQQIVNDKKVSDHHAILPTNAITKEKYDNLPTAEKTILTMLLYRLLAAVAPAHVYKATSIVFDVEGETFKATGKEVIHNGYKFIEERLKAVLNATQEAQEQDEPDNAALPPLSEGDTRLVIDLIAKEKKTKPPQPYTEDTLLDAMETAGKNITDNELREAMKDHGLGTPATRAGIIEHIVKNGFVVRKGKALLPTETAITFMDVVTTPVKQPELTAEWEKQLADIQHGKTSADTFMQGIANFLTSFIGDTKTLVDPNDTKVVFHQPKEPLGLCPRCGKNVIEYPKSFSCESGKHGCGFVVWKQIAGKAINKTQAKKLLAQRKTDLIQGFRSKANKPFDAHIILKEDGTTGFEFENKKD